MTPEDISGKIITFSKYLKSGINEVVISVVVKEKAEAVNKLLKDTCAKKICILFVTVTLMLKSGSHVPENFTKLKLSPVLFKKIPAFVCLVFKNENK